MSTTTNPGRRPTMPHRDYAVAGDAVVVSVHFTDPATGEADVTNSVSLLGPGRDAADRDEVVARFDTVLPVLRESDPTARVEVSRVYSSMLELVGDFDLKRASGTFRSMLAREQHAAEHRQAVAEWAEALEAIGHEPCDRCGGAGGYHGWPGFTCYECNGVGHVEAKGGRS